MEINKQLFEAVLSGKLKGKFIFRNAHNMYGVELKPNHTCVQKPKDGFYIIRMPRLLFNVVDSNGKSVYCCIEHKEETENDPNFDVVDFCLDAVKTLECQLKENLESLVDKCNDKIMKENELTIEIPDGKIVDWEESKKQNKIVLKDKQLTYDDVCEKLFEKGYYYTCGSGCIGQRKVFVKDFLAACPNYASTSHQLECILAKNKLANVAAYLNDGWKPNKGDRVFVLSIKGDFENSLSVVEYYFGAYYGAGENLILFKTQKAAQQAIEILGGETIKLALEPLGV